MDSPVLSTMRCRLVPGRARRRARGEMLTASRERGVIGCREIDAQHPEDRCQEALGLTQRSVEDETERQGGFDGEIGILEVPAPPAAAHVAIASGVSQRVTSPRRTRARSYSAQFPTRYVVLYFGYTLDFTSRS